MNNKLYQKAESKKFYENRYSEGYMLDWPKENKQRVFNVIKSMNLPDSGTALDFGCGNGVFTDILQQALPGWEIYGCDISQTAIKNASDQLPECTFFVSSNVNSNIPKFDFMFSHHVLEHVFDIKKTFEEMNDLMNPKSYSLLIFPCGNDGSLEHKVCKMRTDGIDKNVGNRFFFEDEGHVRRLTTLETNKLMNDYNFKLVQDFYSNHYYGALKWISQSSVLFILNFANPKKAIDKDSLKYLTFLRYKLLFLKFIQFPAVIFKSNIQKLNSRRSVRSYLFPIIGLIPFILSYPAYAVVNSKANNEWNRNKRRINGSEMFLFYERTS